MLRILAAICLIVCAAPAMTEGTHTIALQIIPLEPFAAGRPMHAIARLTHVKDGSPVLPEELAVVHTQKIHLLIIDETLTDFQHVHPDLAPVTVRDCPKWHSCRPGEYPFIWTPVKEGHYRAWADMTPLATRRQEYAMAEVPSPAPGHKQALSVHEMVQNTGGYRFTLSFDTSLTAGTAALGHLHVTGADGGPLCPDSAAHPRCLVLEPVLGAFAHAAGFNEDFRTVLHAHPMGEEPKDDSARGEPDLYFHLAPPKPGFYNLFIQVKIRGKTLFVPFSLRADAAKMNKKTP